MRKTQSQIWFQTRTNARLMIKRAEVTTIMPKLPSFLASIKYKNLTDRHRFFFDYVNDTNLNMFGWFYAHSEQFKIFNEYQSATAKTDENRFQYILKSLLSSAMGLQSCVPIYGQFRRCASRRRWWRAVGRLLEMFVGRCWSQVTGDCSALAHSDWGARDCGWRGSCGVWFLHASAHKR